MKVVYIVEEVNADNGHATISVCQTEEVAKDRLKDYVYNLINDCGMIFISETKDYTKLIYPDAVWNTTYVSIETYRLY